MGMFICRKMFLVGACMMAGCMAWGQQVGPEQKEPARFEVAFTYDSILANVTTGNEFWMQGGTMQFQARLWHGLGVVADVSGLHTANVNNTGTGLDLIIAAFGPRYTWSPTHGRFAFFGHVLAGEAHGMNSIFPSGAVFNSSGNSLALEIGGGVNLPLARHFSVRAFDANWLRTQLPNATTNMQNNLRLGAGIVYRFK
jgi:hypothetical protein